MLLHQKRVIALCVAAAAVCAGVLQAQSNTYAFSVPAVTTGPVQTSAFSIQVSTPNILTLPVAPVEAPLRVFLYGPVSVAGTPLPGYSISDALMYASNGNGFIVITFNSTDGSGAFLSFTLLPNPPSLLDAVGTYPLSSRATLYPPPPVPPANPPPAVQGDPVNATLTISSGPLPILSKDPPSLFFKYQQGGAAPLPAAVSLTSSGAPLDFSVTTSGDPWLSVFPGSGTTPGSLLVSVNPAGLPNGYYVGFLRIFAAGAMNSLDGISVSLSVLDSTPPPPEAYPERVVNAASFAAPAGPNGSIAQGSRFVIDGFYLGPDAEVDSGYPLTTNLAGTSVTVTMGSNLVDALILSTSSNRVVGILPSSTPTGIGSAVVSYNGASSYPVAVTVVATSFGIVTSTGNGMGPAAVSGEDGAPKTLASPARPGEILTLTGTGLGAIAGDESIPAATADSRFTPEVLIGNLPAASVAYAGRSACCAGQDEIRFEVPAGVEGCFIPLAVRNGGITSNFTSLPVSSDGPCTGSPGFGSTLPDSASSGGPVNAAMVAIGPAPILQYLGFDLSKAAAQRLAAILGKKVDPQDVRRILRASPANRRTLLIGLARKYGVRSPAQARRLQAQMRGILQDDSQGAAAVFGQFSNLQNVALPFMSYFPDSGTCTVIRGFPNSSSTQTQPVVRTLDAGSELSMSTPVGAKTLAKVKPGEYQAFLGSGFPPGQAPEGTYGIAGNGGADVGPFAAELKISSGLHWDNKASISTVDRTQPLSITWSGGGASPPGHVLFGGFAGGQSGGLFVCVQDAAAGTLTVPVHVLSSLGASHGYLFLGVHPFETMFAAPGLDAAFLANFSNDSSEVDFR